VGAITEATNQVITDTEEAPPPPEDPELAPLPEPETTPESLPCSLGTSPTC
jgi:hypothetical protein